MYRGRKKNAAGLRESPAWLGVRKCAAIVPLWLVLLLVFPLQSHAEDNTHADHTSPSFIRGVDSIAMIVADIDRSLDFYSKVLAFEKVSDSEVAGEDYERLFGVFGLRLRQVRMKLGEESVTFIEFLAPRGRAVPVDSRSNDRWFQHIAIITNDMDRAYRHLREHKVEHASSGPQRLPDWNPKAAGILAFYFKDPDGHPLEFLQFPPGKGDPKWQAAKDELFLGIDHTAIVVGDTDRSVAFYRDILGLQVVGESENYGTEQEHLNNVFGARLRITTLRATRGPGVELLEYLSPRNGRELPADARLNDLVRTQVRFMVHSPEKIEAALRPAVSGWISPGAVTFEHPEPATTTGMTLQDPDGHILQFIAR